MDATAQRIVWASTKAMNDAALGLLCIEALRLFSPVPLHPISNNECLYNPGVELQLALLISGVIDIIDHSYLYTRGRAVAGYAFITRISTCSDSNAFRTDCKRGRSSSGYIAVPRTFNVSRSVAVTTSTH